MAKTRKREEVKKEDTWALEDLYASEQLFEEDCGRLAGMIEEFPKYKGRLKEGSGVLLKMLEDYSGMNKLFEKVYVYANQRLHQDMGNAASQKSAASTEVWMDKMNAAESYMVPEILGLPEKLLTEYCREERELEKYRRFLDEIFRQKPHTLDERSEEILAKAGELAKASSNVFTMFNNADITFRPVTDEKGKEEPLTQGRYTAYMQSPDRRVRREAFANLYQGYAGFKNTLAALYEANAKKTAFYAKMRNYGSSLEAALDDSEIPVAVYDSLIDSVHGHMEPMYRYMRLRKKVLGVEELHMYDVYVPMVQEVDMKVSFERAKEIVKEGLAPLGKRYQALLQEGFDSRWIDIYENENKRTGAYSWGAYGTHPYVLLNYQESLKHSDHEQEYLYAGYRIFVAEVASTCNEALLIRYMIEKSRDSQEKAYLINYFLEQFRTTLYRQTMFAEFEKMTHEMVDEGGTLNAETLCGIYFDLNKKYYGPDVVSDEEIQYEWSRIPHFYRAFYVYQYATGFGIGNEEFRMVEDSTFLQGVLCLSVCHGIFGGDCHQQPDSGGRRRRAGRIFRVPERGKLEVAD